MSEPRIINPTTPLMPVWIQVVNYQMESLLHRFDRPRSSKAGYVAMNGLRLVTVGMMLMETVRTAVLRHWFPNPQPTVRFADESRCRVVSGRWISPFTGKVIQNSSEIDIETRSSAQVGAGSAERRVGRELNENGLQTIWSISRPSS